MADFAMPIGKVVSQLVLQIRVTGLRTLRVRVWLGLQVMKLAAAIIGTQVSISIEKSDPPRRYFRRVGNELRPIETKS